MRCRSCGHDNPGRSTGRCDNCGFKLDDQNLPLKEMRSALQKPLDEKGADLSENPPELIPRKTHHSGLLGLFIFLVGAVIAVYIISNYERSVYEPEVDLAELAAIEEEIPLDSLPIMLGTDIVYVFNEEGTAASPRTNVDLSLIPEGTGVSFLASGSLSIQPVVNYMQQKINGNDFKYLSTDSLFAWTDSTETAYLSVPVLKPVPSPEQDSTAVQPVDFKILFTDEWLRFMVDEYNTDIVEPAGGYAFDQRAFTRLLGQVERTIERRNTDGRPVEVTLLFPGTSSLFEAVAIAESVQVYTDSLGYRGFHIKWVNVTE